MLILFSRHAAAAPLTLIENANYSVARSDTVAETSIDDKDYTATLDARDLTT